MPMLPYGKTTRLLIAIVAQVLLVACGSSRANVVDQLAQRPDLHEAYKTFALRCSKCHSLARPLNSGITDDNHWDQYVARMRRQPGSGINQADSLTILRFLHALAAEERRRTQYNAEPEPSPAWSASAGSAP